jgi:hypothetical protein
MQATLMMLMLGRSKDECCYRRPATHLEFSP